MAYYGYGNDDDLDLEFVTSFEKEEQCYSFDTFQVMYHRPSKTYRVGEDSGCSCLCPFEDFRTLADWGRPLTVTEVIQEIMTTRVAGPTQIDEKRIAMDEVRKHAKEVLRK